MSAETPYRSTACTEPVTVRTVWSTQSILTTLMNALLGPVLLAGCAWWLWRVVRIWGHNFEYGHLLVTCFGALFSAVALLAGIAGVLSAIEAPVCNEHTDRANPFGSALEYWQGTLCFASYRYYKAFCELNNITRGDPDLKG